MWVPMRFSSLFDINFHTCLACVTAVGAMLVWDGLTLHHCMVVVGGAEFTTDFRLSCRAGRIDASSVEVHEEWRLQQLLFFYKLISSIHVTDRTFCKLNTH